ncbi:hypothetical protein M9H77_03433 [Catharanthus roseus]|uniref:Uncharacterized protein n=1 Tax=Catharanthus roseus TaxID=4058 RepID=A0ACC0CBA0_CATRO|nr:hypothetical protein M9H77_03433 [Catharanthus roseus]
MSLGHYLGSPDKFLLMCRLSLIGTEISFVMNPLLLPILPISDFRLMIHAHVPRYFLENTLSLLVVEHLGTEILSIDAHPVHHFIDELSPMLYSLPLTVGSSINQSMEDIDEGIEEGVTPGTGLSQWRKRTRAALKGALSSKTSAKKARAVTPSSAPLKAKIALNKHFIQRFQEVLCHLTEEFGNPESPAYGQIYVRGHVIDFSPENIARYLSCPYYNDIEGTSLKKEADFDKVTKVLTGDAGAVWPETNRLNSNSMKMPYKACFRVFCGNWLSTTNDLSLPFDSWVRPLEPLMMPKNIAPGVLPPSPTTYTQGHTGPNRFTRQQSSKKKLPSTNSLVFDLKQCQRRSLWKPIPQLESTQIDHVTAKKLQTIASSDRSCTTVQHVEDLEGFKIKQFIQKGSLEELKGFNCSVCKRVCTVVC